MESTAKEVFSNCMIYVRGVKLTLPDGPDLAWWVSRRLDPNSVAVRVVVAVVRIKSAIAHH